MDYTNYKRVHLKPKTTNVFHNRQQLSQCLAQEIPLRVVVAHYDHCWRLNYEGVAEPIFSIVYDDGTLDTKHRMSGVAAFINNYNHERTQLSWFRIDLYKNNRLVRHVTIRAVDAQDAIAQIKSSPRYKFVEEFKLIQLESRHEA